VFYARPEGYQIQRSGDGGIGIFAGNAVPGAQALRQTRRYFRYQAGKGIQYSTSATFRPNNDIVSVTVSGSTATITTDQDHGLRYGAMVNLRNIAALNATDLITYNGTYSVSPIVSLTPRSFGVQLSGTPSDTAPGVGIATVETADAKGFCIRCGLFDDQNGFFYEFDGTYLNAVRRNGTTVLRGTANVLTGSSVLIGTGATYTRQAQPGDKVIIRGQTYEVTQIINDTVMHIAPPYRAATPASASGTGGIPFGTISAASSTTSTITIAGSTVNAISTSLVTLTASAGTGAVGVVGAYVLAGTIPSNANTTLSAQAAQFATSMTVTSATGIFPGMLVVVNGAGNLPANTYVASTYVTGSTTVPLTQGFTTTTASATTVYFYYSPASGMNITGVGIPNGTQISNFSNVGGTVGATITIQVYINQAISATVTASSYLIGSVPGLSGGYTTTTTVIALTTTYGIAPGMVISGTGVPGNCIVASLATGGVGVVLNQGITTTVANSLSLTFVPQHSLYAVTIATSGSTASGATSIVLANVLGIQVGSFITGSANLPLGSFVTAISGNTVTFHTPYLATQGTTGIINTATNLVFGSRIFVYNTSQVNANGTWPVTGVTATAITFQTAAATTVTGVISIYGSTKVFGEDIAVKKYQVRELRNPQFQFNLDTIDGTGPSGYNMDLTKIQMIYIDYTWYGAGFIRWGMRGVNGDIIYIHKTQHGNREYLAFQRSGNLPGRFEAVNAPARTPITANIAATGYTMAAPGSTVPGTISVYDASRFLIPNTRTYGEASNGEINIENEIFYYTGVTATTTSVTTGNPSAVVQSSAQPWTVTSTAAPWAIGATGLTAVASIGTVTVSGGAVASIPLISGGNGYTSAPPVVISGGGGAGAVAKAIVINGAVTQVVVTSGGYGYTSAPTVIVGPNQLTGCFRESTIVSSVGTWTGNMVLNTNVITGVSSTIAPQLLIGCVIAPSAAFGFVTAKVVGVSGTNVYVDQPCVASNSYSFTLLNRGNVTATAHSAYNTSNLPMATAYNTSIQIIPNVQHWGVSAIMDGRYDADISYVFTTPRSTAAVVLPNATSPLISLRVSPSSSNGFARNFGVRDVIMRMQAKLYQMDVYNSGSFLVTVKYNCASATFTPALWTANTVGSGSLSQVIYHNPSDIVTGGDIVLAFYANASGGTNFTATSADLTVVKDLGNSVYGGDGVFPDGPDCITIFATNLSTTTAQALFARVSWTEAQA